MVELDEMWGKGSIGVLLTDAYFTNNQNINADYLGARMRFSGVSARRWLDDLVERGLVVLDADRGRKFYRTTEEHAQRTLAIIESVDRFAPNTRTG